MRRRTVSALTLVGLLAVLVYLFYPPLFLVETGEYQRTAVTVQDSNGTDRATVDVRVADTEDKRRVGLSRTDSLSGDAGMLFVHPEEGEYAYVMRGMSFSIDIVFVAANGTITRVHREASPERLPISRYRGTGKYVLEVPAGWTDATGVATGDTVQIPETVTAADG